MSITIYTDGGCQYNPGPGAWAFILLDANKEIDKIEQSGFAADTTNNRMELLAVISALRYVQKEYPAEQELKILTDSQYVQRGITLWIERWKQNGWKTANKKPVKNRELWEDLHKSIATFNIQWAWVPGHSDVYYNECCDTLVQKTISAGKDSLSSP